MGIRVGLKDDALTKITKNTKRRGRWFGPVTANFHYERFTLCGLVPLCENIVWSLKNLLYVAAWGSTTRSSKEMAS